MTDLARTIAPKSDQLNADDLIAGPRTITITQVRGSEDADQPISIHFEGDEKKPYKPCKSMRRVMVHCWGADGNAYTGRRMTLVCDPNVVFGGIKVGGIRISHMSDIDRDRTMALTVTRAQRRPYTVHPLPGDRSGQRASLVDLTAILEDGRAAALQGSARLTEWWGDLSKAEKAAVKPALDSELKSAAARIDQAAFDNADPDTGEILESDLPGHDDEPEDEGFPGDRPAASDFDVQAWARDIIADETRLNTVAEIEDFFADKEATRQYHALEADAPALAKSLVAALNGRKKAAASRAQG